ncbi:TatD family hydrolase [Paenibacillus apiarius]|uniref:TatD family hydrolase n=1 Tax=Paenibacillus apiarius TaxID=46240 RepID=A0ABT4DNH7_9BACL|nr:TatD family hydrolase [Paenibacillus apiarius]MCY9515503.1 TatD family hydrolase [Paenibacillus apiarius]MCY9518912.1 TatD family hydrolase [Paenibacillus apiarius]MCY9552042.1 TatD family hydrolase [Paenibacillus apiarius]MCY9557282.1 TatD family hydrolase [Paenibacillus apiarius]MCY9682539.1 TatD family hydrolase [Paenibacillus apiarius]
MTVQGMQPNHSNHPGELDQPVYVVDTHIHLDLYEPGQTAALEQSLESPELEYVVAVSMGLESGRRTKTWAERYPGRVLPAYGFHPEQTLPSEAELASLLAWMDAHAEAMIAVGEVGLPYYMRQEALEQGRPFERQPYLELLEPMVKRAAAWDKPIVLHAVYDDAPLVIDLLERFSVKKAHFHWFKGDARTVEHMARNGYFISFTPDIAYEEEIQTLARRYPVEQVMTETDGPWPFEGSWAGQVTLPTMVHAVAGAWARIHAMDIGEAAVLLRNNARCCYGV